MQAANSAATVSFTSLAHGEDLEHVEEEVDHLQHGEEAGDVACKQMSSAARYQLREHHGRITGARNSTKFSTIARTSLYSSRAARM